MVSVMLRRSPSMAWTPGKLSRTPPTASMQPSQCRSGISKTTRLVITRVVYAGLGPGAPGSLTLCCEPTLAVWRLV